MNHQEKLLARLDEIGRSLSESGDALALIGLGSVGIERERLDAYSDLDFFAIVKAGYKAQYIENIEWLSSLCPIAFQFRNTRDGYKLLFADGIFCEMAVFEPAELEHIPFGQGKIIWKRDGVEAAIAVPVARLAPQEQQPIEWLLGEALTNLYVGMARVRRGEVLSGTRFIQQYAVDRVLELAPFIEAETDVTADRFANERRFEQRFPQTGQELPLFCQGYARNRESALAILASLERHWTVNPGIAEAIRGLCRA